MRLCVIRPSDFFISEAEKIGIKRKGIPKIVKLENIENVDTKSLNKNIQHFD